MSGALPISHQSLYRVSQRQRTWESPIGLLFSWGTQIALGINDPRLKWKIQEPK